MPRSVHVHLLPSLAPPEQLVGKTIVVIDVLRATTTIVHALAAGAREVIPCLEIGDALEQARALGASAVLGGERGGQKIEGFRLGNSPREYTPEIVAGKHVVFTTTNGTRAMMRCREAGRVLIGAFVNFSALCGELAAEEQVEIICAGTDGEVTREDTLLAGAIVDEMTLAAGSDEIELNDQAEIAADAWQAAAGGLAGESLLADAMRHSRGGRNLIEIGHENDIAIAAEIDKFELVPQLDLAAWRIALP